MVKILIAVKLSEILCFEEYNNVRKLRVREKGKKRRKIHNYSIQHNKPKEVKLLLILSPLTTLSREIKWAYSAALSVKHGSRTPEFLYYNNHPFLEQPTDTDRRKQYGALAILLLLMLLHPTKSTPTKLPIKPREKLKKKTQYCP